MLATHMCENDIYENVNIRCERTSNVSVKSHTHIASVGARANFLCPKWRSLLNAALIDFIRRSCVLGRHRPSVVTLCSAMCVTWASASLLPPVYNIAITTHAVRISHFTFVEFNQFCINDGEPEFVSLSLPPLTRQQVSRVCARVLTSIFKIIKS